MQNGAETSSPSSRRRRQGRRQRRAQQARNRWNASGEYNCQQDHQAGRTRLNRDGCEGALPARLDASIRLLVFYAPWLGSAFIANILASLLLDLKSEIDADWLRILFLFKVEWQLHAGLCLGTAFPEMYGPALLHLRMRLGVLHGRRTYLLLMESILFRAYLGHRQNSHRLN